MSHFTDYLNSPVQTPANMAATHLLLFTLLFVPKALGETCDSQEMEERWQRKEEQMEARWKIKEAEMDAKLEAIAASVRDLPYEMVCAFKGGFNTASATIPYDRITSEFNNADRPGGGDGQLDIESGVFTCLTTGHYTVAVSYQADMTADSYIRTHLYMNGVSLEESYMYSRNADSNARIEEMASKTIVSCTYVILWVVTVVCFRLSTCGPETLLS